MPALYAALIETLHLLPPRATSKEGGWEGKKKGEKATVKAPAGEIEFEILDITV